mgnify:CR=1 FL=1
MRARLHLASLRAFGILPKRVQNWCVRRIAPLFTVGPAVVLLDGRGRVLLVQQPYSDGWGLPGGLVARGEEPADTARREIREELGLEIDVAAHPIAVRTPWRRHFNFLFTVVVPDMDPVSMLGLNPEISDVDLFDLLALPDLSECTDDFLVAVGALAAASAPG